MKIINITLATKWNKISLNIKITNIIWNNNKLKLNRNSYFYYC